MKGRIACIALAMSVSAYAAIGCPTTLVAPNTGFTLFSGSNKVMVFGRLEDSQKRTWSFQGSFGNMRQIDVQVLHRLINNELKNVTLLYKTEETHATACYYKTPEGHSVEAKHTY